ncbi:MAG: RNA polymerase sigma factor [Methylococcaceae bacterium]
MGEAFQLSSDTQLWSDFLLGSEKAYKIIYDAHVQAMFKFGMHFTKNEEIIHDCIHDVFIDLHKYRTNLHPTDNIKKYLFISLKRKLFKILDKEGRYVHFDAESPLFSYSLSVSTEIDDELTSRQFELLEKAMLELSNRQREAIYLRYVTGLSYDELSEVLHMNYQSARNLIFRGIEKLKESCQNKSLVLFCICEM